MPGKTDKTLELQIKIATQEALASVSSLKGELELFAQEAARLAGEEAASLAATFSKTQEAAERAAASFKLFGSSSGELRQVQKELKEACIELVRDGMDPESEEIKELIEEYKKLEQAASDIDEANGSNIDSFGKLKNSITNLAEVAAALKALNIIKDMGVFALETADSFQTARNQFGILLGDMKAGAGLFNEIKAFGDITPFDLDTLTQATNVLISAKVPLSDLKDQLTKFGDLSQGNSQRLTSYIHAFSQAAAKGKADMQVLNTYLNQGVDILGALANNFNKTEAEIMEMSSQGKISFADFSRALDDLTAAGGRYFGGMETASRSLAAMKEGLSEAVNTLAASFGDMLMPAAIGVLEALTSITKAINESPIAKGIFAGAVITITGLLAAKAVQAGIAFAAQMKLNLAIGALNAPVMAATIAVAALAAGYTMVTAKNQEATREAEAAALAQMKQRDAINSSTNAANGFADALNNMTDANISSRIESLNSAMQHMSSTAEAYLSQAIAHYESGSREEGRLYEKWWEEKRKEVETAKSELEKALKVQGERQTNWIDSMYSNTPAGRIQGINEKIAETNRLLSGANLSDADRDRLQEIARGLNAELTKLNNTGKNIDFNKIATDWKKAWNDVWEQSRAEQSDDPFAMIEFERAKRLADAHAHYVRDLDRETIDQINTYYDEERSKVIKKLHDEEMRALAGLTKTKVDDLMLEKFEKQAAVMERRAQKLSEAIAESFKTLSGEIQNAFDSLNSETIPALEAGLKITNINMSDAAYSDLDKKIEEINQYFDYLDQEIELEYKIKFKKEELDRMRESVVSWQKELSDSLLLGLANMKVFSEQAAVIIADLTTQLIELSASAMLSGFEEFGRALGQGKDAAESLSQALAQMAQQILNQLPMMFLQAGLQLIANGQWALGLGFVAAGLSSAVLSGFVDGRITKEKEEASKHAQGGVFDEYGQAARTFASGGAFTNQIVNTPTHFAHGGGFGLMGEAGPEAIMPLTRMPNGDLGVQTAGGGARVTINVINYSNTEVRKEETESADGSRQIDVIIGQLVNNHITSGKADRAIGGRFGLKVAGV